ncbi:MAG: hypothetical protein ABW007_19155 [Chitinophagaceae bacterium]
MDALKQIFTIFMHVRPGAKLDDKPATVEAFIERCHEGRGGYYLDFGGLLVAVPDYTADLNVMHEAEKTLNAKECLAYHAFLQFVMPSANRGKSNSYTWGATAAQRAEAFLKTIGQWEEDENLQQLQTLKK